MQLASGTFSALWWLSAFVGVCWASLVVWLALGADYPPDSTAAEIVLVIAGLLAIGLLPWFGIITLRWIFTGRWRFGPRSA
jgi:hypothetical protein